MALLVLVNFTFFRALGNQKNLVWPCVVFTALHGMQTLSSDENSVCLSFRPSVCPSVCQTRDL